MEVATEAGSFGRPEDNNVTPTGPRFPDLPRPAQAPTEELDLSLQKTPTRDSFHEATAKRPLPGSEDASGPSPPAARRGSVKSLHSIESADIEMGEGDEVQDASDDESVEGDSERPSKKKKSQRFFCTDYPPCQLSFTRSEHLARHIRKHTGERPFQCHCLRRFSRLDNLRQHAQTVHVNEEIPGDSLAATGTRFQRQIRTDRVRPSGQRPRASTLGTGGHSRGHSRNLSNSSVGSISDMGSPDDLRRRQAPLSMTQTTPPRPGLTLDTYNASLPDNNYPSYYNYSPSGYSTPASLLSADAASPRQSQTLASPISLAPRSLGWGGQNHSRRLSVPNAPNPFQSSTSFASPVAPFLSPNGSSTAPSYSNSQSGAAQIAKPSYPEGHRDSAAAEADWRRRTWHPGTYSNLESRPATSSLSYYQTPDAPQPVSASQPAAQQAVRLPGIDSFDRGHPQTAVPLRRPPSAMEVDEGYREADSEVSSKRDSWGSMSQNLNQLDLTHATPPKDTHMWRYSGSHQPQTALRPSTSSSSGPEKSPRAIPPPLTQVPQRDGSLSTAEQPVTPKSIKRQGWYGARPASGEIQASAQIVRTSPEGSSSSDGLPTPSATSMAESHPAIVQSNGYVEYIPEGVVDDPTKTTFHNRPSVSAFSMHAAAVAQKASFPRQNVQNNSLARSNNTDRLDALVEVATREEQAVRHH